MFKTVKGLLAGIIAGTAIGVLFAPKKGKEIRKKIKDEIGKGGYGLDTLKEAVTEMGKDIEETGKEVYKENVPADTKRKAKKAFSKVKSKVKEVIKKVQE